MGSTWIGEFDFGVLAWRDHLGLNVAAGVFGDPIGILGYENIVFPLKIIVVFTKAETLIFIEIDLIFGTPIRGFIHDLKLAFENFLKDFLSVLFGNVDEFWIFYWQVDRFREGVRLACDDDRFVEIFNDRRREFANDYFRKFSCRHYF